MAKRATKPVARPGWKIERLTHGRWLWVILPTFRSEPEAQAYVATLERQDQTALYRVSDA